MMGDIWLVYLLMKLAFSIINELGEMQIVFFISYFY